MNTRHGLALLALGLVASPAGAVTLTVFGTANPNLAGRTDGYACCSGDSVPTHSPAEVIGLGFSAGDALIFSATGGVAVGPSVPATNTPDGVSNFSMTNYGDGISAPTFVRVSALMGVFLSAGDPTGGVTPAQLSFAAGINFASLTPGLNQIFFIGDGLTSSSFVAGPPGAQQLFYVPSGATRLFLGTSDGFGWFNNGGSFRVEVSIDDGGPTPVPAPAPPTLALLLMALGATWLARARAVA